MGVHTKFGTEGESVNDPAFQDEMDLIVGKAMEGYVRSEYGNLWETHQCRPHAYGHTWSPGYELPAGMLHGHAVATCMGYGAYLAHLDGFVTTQQLERIMKLISNFELSLWHPIMNSSDRIWGCNTKIIAKRGGHFCAPVPCAEIGSCGYIQELSFKQVETSIEEYRVLCESFPRSGLGVEVHCVDVGLEDPSKVKSQNEWKCICNFCSEVESENKRLRAALAEAEGANSKQRKVQGA